MYPAAKSVLKVPLAHILPCRSATARALAKRVGQSTPPTEFASVVDQIPQDFKSKLLTPRACDGLHHHPRPHSDIMTP